MSVFRTLIQAQSTDWKIPSDWTGHDIRKNCPDNAIALKAGVSSDYSSYDNLGIKVKANGGYKVYIDNTQYGDIYASESVCSITWSNYSDTQGHSITTPETLTAHDIIIIPAETGIHIESIQTSRVASSGTEVQGILWAHFNIDYSISLWHFLYTLNTNRNPLCISITAKNNLLKASVIGYYNEYYSAVRYNRLIEHQPVFDFSDAVAYFCDGCGITGKQKTITIKNLPKKVTTSTGLFFGCEAEKIKLIDCDTSGIKNWKNIFNNCIHLKKVPDGLDFSSMTTTDQGFMNMEGLQNQVMDFSTAINATTIRVGGITSSHFCNGLIGIIVPQATNLTTLSITYCNIDKNAMNDLFDSLPDYTGTGKSPVLVMTGCPCTSDWTTEEKAVAENKGWSVGA